jgi:hypothetical protein
MMKYLPPPTTLPRPLPPQDEADEARLGAELRDEALAGVSRAADPTWIDAALDALHAAASEQSHVTSDDVWHRLPDDVSTHDNRAMGAVFVRGQGLGWIMFTEATKPTGRAIAHRNPKRVWRSLIYEGERAEDFAASEDGGAGPEELDEPDTRVSETTLITTDITETTEIVVEMLGATEVDELPPGDDAWASGTEAAITFAAIQMAAMRAVAGQRRRNYYLMACPDHGYWLLSTGPGGITKTSTWMGCCATCRRAESEDEVKQIMVPSFPTAPLLGREELTKIAALEAEALGETGGETEGETGGETGEETEADAGEETGEETGEDEETGTPQETRPPSLPGTQPPPTLPPPPHR